jgi:hypothetical protein
LKRYEDAERLHRQSLEVLRSCCGDEHPDYARRLADHAHILRRLNRKEEAKILAARAASIRQRQPGEDNSSSMVDIEDLRRK